MTVALCAVRAMPNEDPGPNRVAGIHCQPLWLSKDLTQQLQELSEGHAALVAIAQAPKAIPALHQAGRTVPGLLVVDSRRGAERVICLLHSGMSAAEIAYPPLFTPDRLLSAAPDNGQDTWQVRLDPKPLEQDEPWLALEHDTVVVASQALSPLELAAVKGRTGLAKTGQRHLLIGPCNYAAQGQAWAAAVQTHVPGVEARNITIRRGSVPGPGFVTDISADAAALGILPARVDIALDAVLPATHVLNEDTQTLLSMEGTVQGKVRSAEFRHEAEAIMASGRELAVVVHGSAGRTPSRHAAFYPLSPFADPTQPITAMYEKMAIDTFEALAGLGVPLFTATLDMLDFLEDATWLPIVISPANFAPAPPWGPDGRLKVMHMPSSDLKKGTTWVDEGLTQLENLGVIEYRRYSGIHPNLVPALLRQVDVVVDQVSLGNVATLANQTMAAGRLSLGRLAPHVRRRYPEEPPVVNVDPTTLSDVIWQIAKDPQRYESQAVAGPGFARRLHDGRLTAKVLEPWLLGEST